jgi:chromosome segregation ATPase
VVVDGRPIRLLADLADKPWAAEDGEPWKATFPYTIDRAQPREAELTVAPDVTITLPAPERLVAAASKKSASSGARASRQPGLRQAGSRSQNSADAASDRLDQPRRKSRTSTVGGEPREADALMRELADLRDIQRRLRQQLDRVQADKANTTQRLHEVSRELREVRHEREESNAAHDRIAAELEAVQRERAEIAAERETALGERDRMAVDREAAQRTHDQALQASEVAGVARDRALSERGAALAAQRQAASERNAAIATRDQAVAERDAALSLRDHALAERDAAVAERDQAVSVREALSDTTERLHSELADLLSARGAALVMRRAAQAPAVSRRYARIFPGAITIAAVLAIVLILVILLRVV